MIAKMMPDGTVRSFPSEAELRKVDEMKDQEILIDALKTKIEVCDKKILVLHQEIEQAEKEREAAKQKITELVNE